MLFEILGSKHIGGHDLTFRSHVTSSVTWSFDSPQTISYWWSFRTASLSQAVLEIFGSKHRPIGVTTLTFQDHVTSLVASSVTWPFDSP